MAVVANITIDQGSDFTSSVTVEDVAGNPMNLTGYTASGQIRKTYYSTTAIDFTASVTSAANGLITIELDKDTTKTMKPGRYVYDLEIESSGGTVTRVVEGQLEVMPSVTRS